MLDWLQKTTPFYFAILGVFAIAEFIWYRSRRDADYDIGALGANLGVALGQIISSLLTGTIILAALFFTYGLSPYQWSISSWQSWVLAFFLMEFAYYWQHRYGHTVRWFWATHAVHHSSNQLVLPAALRIGWTGGITGVWVFFLPVALLGFHPLQIILLLVISLRFQYFLHTESIGTLGWVDLLLNTPANHRVHHASEPECLNKNFGGITMIFDHLFGTYAAEKDRHHVYGLTDPITSNNPFVITFREWGRLIDDVFNQTALRKNKEA